MLPKTMKAVCFHRYGSPEELVIEDFPVPVPEKDEVLVKMRATSFSPADAKARNGWYSSMYELKFPRIPGIEIAGTVAAKGADVDSFEIGDQIMAFNDKRKGGSLAEYCAVKAEYCCLAPKNVELATVAAIPGYALCAMQALTEEAPLQKGQRALVVGAAGGVGQMAVQIAKYKGAYVIGCDMGECHEDILQNGAHEAILPGKDALARFAQNKLDVVVSAVTLTEEDLREYLKAMNPGGYFVSTLPLKNKVYEGPDYDGKRGLESLCLSLELQEEFKVHCIWMTVKKGGERLRKIAALLESGDLKIIINKTLTMHEYKQLNYDFEAGKVRGRNLILIEGHI